MEQVPNIISTKDFAYISDMFGWNFVAAKEINHFANEVDNGDLKKLLFDISQMHTEHCKFLINILQGGETDEQED